MFVQPSLQRARRFTGRVLTSRIDADITVEQEKLYLISFETVSKYYHIKNGQSLMAPLENRAHEIEDKYSAMSNGKSQLYIDTHHSESGLCRAGRRIACVDDNFAAMKLYRKVDMRYFAPLPSSHFYCSKYTTITLCIRSYRRNYATPLYPVGLKKLMVPYTFFLNLHTTA